MRLKHRDNIYLYYKEIKVLCIHSISNDIHAMKHLCTLVTPQLHNIRGYTRTVCRLQKVMSMPPPPFIVCEYIEAYAILVAALSCQEYRHGFDIS
jgi:hypothetical protein